MVKTINVRPISADVSDYLEARASVEIQFKEKARKALLEIFKQSTIDGIPSLIRTKRKFLKIMWFVFILFSFSISIYTICLGFFKYFEYEVVTKIYNVYESSSPFPVITFCYINPFTTNFSIESVSNYLKLNNISNILDAPEYDQNQNITELTRATEKMIFYKYFFQLNFNNPNKSDQFRMNLGNKLDDILLSCLYNLQQCTIDDFEHMYLALYGNCFTFNSGKHQSKMRQNLARFLACKLSFILKNQVMKINLLLAMEC